MRTTYLNLTQNITTLPGLSPLSPHAASGAEGSIYQRTTGEAALISAYLYVSTESSARIQSDNGIYVSGCC